MRMLLLVGVLGLSGCSTAYVHVAQPAELHPYKGSQQAITEIGRSWGRPVVPGEVLVRSAVDLPLCLVADTVLLPIDFLIMLGH
ncbi:YceK/YidQ family lipoprotein [Permianibacter sp. IMCC34836]|uniref:YceK/YidQ family lipoprotein n=1 Tax=Permianibacter fluminis TaxID=2738515 RepID=UPI0015580342|nr:YceK/YidQ family lipoprotein [Permianibacter fluminis]NQD36855.1 YceK/YidQ family lipoprotein [Permianibacter fluminis]